MINLYRFHANLALFFLREMIIVGILALSTCTNITCSGTYAVLKLVVD